MNNYRTDRRICSNQEIYHIILKTSPFERACQNVFLTPSKKHFRDFLTQKKKRNEAHAKKLTSCFGTFCYNLYEWDPIKYISLSFRGISLGEKYTIFLSLIQRSLGGGKTYSLPIIKYSIKSMKPLVALKLNYTRGQDETKLSKWDIPRVKTDF